VGEWNSETAAVGRATSSMAMVVRVSKRRVWKNKILYPPLPPYICRIRTVRLPYSE